MLRTSAATLVLASSILCGPLHAQRPPPIIDMHLHALGAYDQGPAVCTPIERFVAWDQRSPFAESIMGPDYCDEPLRGPPTDEEVRDQTIAIMERLNIYGVLSGTVERVDDWVAAAPDRFIRGLGFRVVPGAPSPQRLRELVESGAVEVLAEVTNQYEGLAPGAEEMAEYWRLAEQIDLPVGIHMGPGPPGAAYLDSPRYRVSLGNPLLLEEVLVRHPGLRVYVMHAGYPYLDEMKAMLYAHPQLYVEVGVIVFTQPREAFYGYLRELVEAGFEDRIMFGSDQMNWPDALSRAVEVIEEAPFLSPAQKRAILYDNAARFLRLSEDERRRHRGG